MQAVQSAGVGGAALGWHRECSSPATMNLDRVDLNLLRVFDAVYEDRNLLRAGERLHLSQSAVSHALARLREALRDELFVRTARGMEPTARAVSMAAPLRDALQRIHDTLGVKPFVAAESARTFVIAANDYVTTVLLGPLSRHLTAVAPSVDLVIRPSTRLDLAAQIDVGRIDMAISIFSDVPARFLSTRVWAQREVIVMRGDHPVGPTVSLGDLARYPLLTVSLGGLEEGAIDGFIVERGLARQSEMFDRRALEDALSQMHAVPRLRMAVPHSLAIPALLRDTDMMSLVPEPLAREFLGYGGIAMRELPYASPSVTLRAVWHQRNEHDPAHAWLREQVVALAGVVQP